MIATKHEGNWPAYCVKAVKGSKRSISRVTERADPRGSAKEMCTTTCIPIGIAPREQGLPWRIGLTILTQLRYDRYPWHHWTGLVKRYAVK
jgi:hypothetical protein